MLVPPPTSGFIRTLLVGDSNVGDDLVPISPKIGVSSDSEIRNPPKFL